MIMIKGAVGKKEYKEPFSKGIMARSLHITDLGHDEAYEIASCIENKLLEENISEISIEDLAIFVTNYLKNYVDPVLAEKYIKWRNVRKSKEPLIILIGGASGVGTSSMAFELASRLGLKNLISTDMIREVMRKIVSKELSPVIHKSSFNAYESIRTPLLGPDPVVEGFISHVDVVNVGVEAVIERALKEGISIIIEGVHIVPGFIKEDLIRKSNVILFTLIVRDEDTHKSRFYSRCRQPWVKRSLDNYLSNFHLIRKTQSFMIDQAIKHNSKIIDNVDVKYTIDIMVNDIIENMEEVMMLDKKVKEIMTTDVITTPSNVDVVNAFEELMEHKISAMPVVDDGELVGIITATDLGHNLILDKYELGTDVKSIMIKDVVTVSPENTIQEAIEIMQSHAPDSNILNQLPVVENGKLVGIISDGDIIKLIL